MTQQAGDRRDVIILGGGLVGLSQALALAAHGISSHIVDRADPHAMRAEAFDGRTFAISSSSVAMFEAVGLAEALAGKGCPIETIWVSDQLRPGALDFVPDEGEGALGMMFESRVLRIALHDAVAAHPLIAEHAPITVLAKERDDHGVSVTLADGRRLDGSLLIVAEGRQSETRDEAGLTPARWQYDHVAIVGAITHERPHGNIAYEIFYPEGPFAMLPMLDEPDGRHRSAIVWSVSRAHAPTYLKLSERAFLAEMQKAMKGMLGEIAMASPISSYPLGFHHTAKITANRLVLVGDCAHGLHPIAGQGVNLGFRDVAALTEVLVEGARLGLEPGDAQLLARYERWRAADALSVATSTDGLTRLFSIPGRTASAVRRFGLGLVRATPPLKRMFIAEARGTAGKLPKLLQGTAI